MAEHSIDDVQQWEIWQVTWLHDDGGSKDRTALAVKVPSNAGAKFVYITSQNHPEVPCRLKIDSSEPSFRHTGLDVTSWIHLADDQIVTVDRLLYRRGHINALTTVYVADRLKRMGTI